MEFTFFDVPYRKKVPLCVVLGIEIEVEVKVVLKIGHLLHFFEVSWFEVRVEK